MEYPLNLSELKSLNLRLEIWNECDLVSHFSSQEGKWQDLTNFKFCYCSF